MRYIVQCIMLLLLSHSLLSCASQQLERRDEQGVSLSLSTDTVFFVSTPVNGRYGEHLYGESGRQVAEAIGSALRLRTNRVKMGGVCASLELACDKARQMGAGVCIFSQIEHWEDRATEWSGRLDRLQVAITVASADTGEELDYVRVVGNSSWFTFGGDHPQDLLARPIQSYVDGLIAGPE